MPLYSVIPPPETAVEALFGPLQQPPTAYSDLSEVSDGTYDTDVSEISPPPGYAEATSTESLSSDSATLVRALKTVSSSFPAWLDSEEALSRLPPLPLSLDGSDSDTTATLDWEEEAPFPPDISPQTPRHELSNLSSNTPTINVIPGESQSESPHAVDSILGLPRAESPKPSHQPYRCTVCDVKCTQMCVVCRSAPYCSKACQKLDWPYHRTLCGIYQTYVKIKVFEQTRLGFSFDAQKSGPELQYIAILKDELVRPALGELPGGKMGLKFKSVLGGKIPDTDGYPIKESRVRGFPTDRTIRAYWHESFLVHGSVPNIAIRQFMDWKQRHDWRGTVVFMTNNSDGQLVDVSMKDLRIVRDFFETSGEPYAGFLNSTLTFGRESYPETGGWIEQVNRMFGSCRRSEAICANMGIQGSDRPMWQAMQQLVDDGLAMRKAASHDRAKKVFTSAGHELVETYLTWNEEFRFYEELYYKSWSS